MKKRISILLTIVMVLTATFSTLTLADYDPKPTNITGLSYTSRTVKVGKTFEIKAYTTPYDCEDDYLVWKTSNSKVVDFEDYDRTGDDMEFVAKKAGTAYVTCYIQGTNISVKCKITVTTKGKAKITVDDKYMDVDVGEWDNIEAKLVGGTYKNRKLTYKVSDKSVIKVKGGRVYGKSVGTAKITIRAKANKKIKKVVHVRVEWD